MSRISPKAKKQIRAKQAQEQAEAAETRRLARSISQTLTSAERVDLYLSGWKDDNVRRAALEMIRPHLRFEPRPRKRTVREVAASLLCRHDDVSVTPEWSRCNLCGRWKNYGK